MCCIETVETTTSEVLLFGSGRRQGTLEWCTSSAAALQCSPRESQQRGEGEDEIHGAEQRRP